MDIIYLASVFALRLFNPCYDLSDVEHAVENIVRELWSSEIYIYSSDCLEGFIFAYLMYSK